MKIALCDDNKRELLQTKRIVEKYINQESAENYEFELKTFNDADSLMRSIDRSGDFDIMILDILMPGMSGMELSSEIRSKGSQAKIIFLTSSPEFALESYKVEAFNYLLKPFDEKELFSVLDKAIESIHKESSCGLLIKEKHQLTRVQFQSLVYVESIKHKNHFHLKCGKIVSCYGTLSEYCNILLEDKRFIKCHKSYIVNMDYIASLSSKELVLTDDTVIPISRQSYQPTKNAYFDYFFSKGI